VVKKYHQRNRPDIRNAYCPVELRSQQKTLPVFAIYPDSWNEKEYGPAPLLGYVYETSEHWAKYAAYDGGIVRYSPISFGPKAVKVQGPVPIPGPVFIRKNKDVSSHKARHNQR
jgi:hypothetical protein